MANEECADFTEGRASRDKDPTPSPQLPKGNIPRPELQKPIQYSKHQDDKGNTVPQGEPCPWAEQWGELISNNGGCKLQCVSTK